MERIWKYAKEDALNFWCKSKKFSRLKAKRQYNNFLSQAIRQGLCKLNNQTLTKKETTNG